MPFHAMPCHATLRPSVLSLLPSMYGCCPQNIIIRLRYAFITWMVLNGMNYWELQVPYVSADKIEFHWNHKRIDINLCIVNCRN